MKDGFTLSFFWSKEFLTSKGMLRTLFWINFLGTIYGYYWYGHQLEETAVSQPLWMLPFVPDSPTASLFFTLTLLFLIGDAKRKDHVRSNSLIRKIIEAIAVTASFKYGIWAVAMIVASISLGTPSSWQDWMLSGSHLGMAVEAILFVRFFRIDIRSLAIAAVWLLSNDFIDYTFGIYPNLPDTVEAYLPAVCTFTVCLSWFSFGLFLSLVKARWGQPQTGLRNS